MDFILQSLTGILTSSNFSLIINHIIQVYCFTYSILCLLTAILTTTHFIYADFLLRVKPIGIASFVLFWWMKLWTSFDQWMVWVNCVIAVYIGLYFYDACCNISQSIDTKKQSVTTHGTILLIINIFMIYIWLWLKKQTLLLGVDTQSQQLFGIFGYKSNYIYLALVLAFFGVNLFRMSERSLFPVLIVVAVMTVTMIVRQLMSRYEFCENLPLETLIYLPFIIDAEGREYLTTKNQVFHRLFLTVVYFYGFVVTNEPDFHYEYFFLGISTILMLLNK